MKSCEKAHDVKHGSVLGINSILKVLGLQKFPKNPFQKFWEMFWSILCTFDSSFRHNWFKEIKNFPVVTSNRILSDTGK